MIHNLIKNASFSHSYQHLYRLDGLEELGVELLFRVEFGNPEQVFEMAKAENKLFELDTLSVYKAIRTFFEHSALKGLVFINIYPSTILHKKFLSFIRNLIEEFPELPQQVVFEIIETEKTDDLELLKMRIRYLKKCGFQIAVDDVGKGWSSLSMIIEMEPDFIKLDRYFAIELAVSPKKQKMIQLLLDFFKDTETKVILEGVETTMDLNAAKSLGILFCQGYLLGMPKPIIVTV